MAIDRLKRIIWRLQELKKPKLSMKEVRKAIMLECGTDERTLSKVLSQLQELGWLKRIYGYVFVIGDTE